MGNNPVNLVDPTGHAGRTINADIGGAWTDEDYAYQDELRQEVAITLYKAQETADRLSESPLENYGGWTKEQFELYKKAYSNVNQSGLGSCSESLECSGVVLVVVLGGLGVMYVMTSTSAAMTQPGITTTGQATVTRVIGHYPEYLKLAGELQVKPFNIPLDVWNKLTPAQQWAANQKFLDRAIAKSAEFVLATPLDKVRPGTFLEREIQYLLSQGYQFVDGASKLIKP